jgi:hypothetical protein
MPRAPETEALHGGYAPIEPRDPRVDGSPMPLSSTATSENHRARNPVDQEAKQY